MVGGSLQDEGSFCQCSSRVHEDGGVRAPTSFLWSQRKSRQTHGLASLDLAAGGRDGQILVLILAQPLISWVTLGTLLTSSGLSFIDCKMGIITVATHSVVS